MARHVHPLRASRWSGIAVSLLLVLSAVALVEAGVLGAQAPLRGGVFYEAELRGDGVVPPVVSEGSGAFTGEGEEGGDEIRFSLSVSAAAVTQVHIHLGGADENGGVVAFLFGPSDPPQDDVSIDGVLTVADLVGAVAGDWDGFVEALFAGAYVQVHTSANPAGELRGQILIALPATPVDPGSGGDEDSTTGVQPASLGAFLDAIVEAGFGPLQLQEIAVSQPWIAVPSAGILILDGAQAEVYSLSAAQAEQAIGNISGENAAYQPPANATVWRGLELVVVLRDAPSNSAVEAALTEILGSPALATIAGPLPPGTGGDDGGGTPVLLPDTGSGGLADPGLRSGSDLALSLLGAGIAVSAMLAGLTVWRRRET